jgi:hypothetical protein
MWDMTKTANKQVPRKEWTKPELRAVVPAARTRGGAFGQNDQDDIAYDPS